jgi:hypothetical protein
MQCRPTELGLHQISLAALAVCSGLSDKITDVPTELDALLKVYRKDIRKAKVKADEALATRDPVEGTEHASSAAFKRATQEWWCEVPKVAVSHPPQTSL